MQEPITDVTVKLTGEDGNAFAVIGKVRAALKEAGRQDLVEEYTEQATSGSYDELLQTTMRYVHVE